MARFGITGHMNLTAGSVPLIYQALRAALEPYTGDELVGISCIARGADSIFAQVVLDLGGKLEVLLPVQLPRNENQARPRCPVRRADAPGRNGTRPAVQRGQPRCLPGGQRNAGVILRPAVCRMGRPNRCRQRKYCFRGRVRPFSRCTGRDYLANGSNARVSIARSRLLGSSIGRPRRVRAQGPRPAQPVTTVPRDATVGRRTIR